VAAAHAHLQAVMALLRPDQVCCVVDDRRSIEMDRCMPSRA